MQWHRLMLMGQRPEAVRRWNRSCSVFYGLLQCGCCQVECRRLAGCDWLLASGEPGSKAVGAAAVVAAVSSCVVVCASPQHRTH
jgi:hypothetical protein